MKIVVVDPRKTVTAEAADLHLAIRPGTDIALYNAMLNVMIHELLVDTRYVEAHTEGFAALKSTVTDYSPSKVAKTCGVRRDDIVEAAHLFARSKTTLSRAIDAGRGQGAARACQAKCEFVVVQEAFTNTDTAQHADLLLPATTWGEKVGTVTNSERRILAVRAHWRWRWESAPPGSGCSPTRRRSTSCRACVPELKRLAAHWPKVVGASLNAANIFHWSALGAGYKPKCCHRL